MMAIPPPAHLTITVVRPPIRTDSTTIRRSTGQFTTASRAAPLSQSLGPLSTLLLLIL
jgi:hypothetical protein